MSDTRATIEPVAINFLRMVMLLSIVARSAYC
jgi:hypothetical protein